MKQTQNNQWKLYRDENIPELIHTFRTKKEAIDYVDRILCQDVIFHFNKLHKVWDAGIFTLTKVGHPEIE